MNRKNRLLFVSAMLTGEGRRRGGRGRDRRRGGAAPGRPGAVVGGEDEVGGVGVAGAVVDGEEEVSGVGVAAAVVGGEDEVGVGRRREGRRRQGGSSKFWQHNSAKNETSRT